MADALNHSSVDVTNELVNHKIHIEGHLVPEYFRINKMSHNYHVFAQKSMNLRTSLTFKFFFLNLDLN